MIKNIIFIRKKIRVFTQSEKYKFARNQLANMLISAFILLLVTSSGILWSGQQTNN